MSDRQKKVDRYLLTADAGTISLIILIAVTMYYYPVREADLNPTVAFALLPIIAVSAFSLTYLFVRRRADEFTLSLWHAGVTTSFVTLILWGVFGGVISGAIQGWSEGQAGLLGDLPTLIEEFSGVFCVAAFFIALQIKRFRG